MNQQPTLDHTMTALYYRCAKCLKLLFITTRGGPVTEAMSEEQYPEGHGFYITYPKYCPVCTDGHPEPGFGK